MESMGARHRQRDGRPPRDTGDILVEVEKLETLLRPTDVADIFGVLAKHACDGCGYRRFVLIGKREAEVVASAGRLAEGHRVQEAARAEAEQYEELLETIEYLKTQSGLMTIMEHKNRMMNGVSVNSERTSQGGPGLGREAHRRGICSRPVRSREGFSSVEVGAGGSGGFLTRPGLV